MSTNNDTTKYIISEAFKKWADKKWFQVLSVIVIIYLLITPILGPVIYSYCTKSNTADAVDETLKQRDIDSRNLHRETFEISKRCYAQAKQVMKESLDDIDCQYLFLLEYHNGAENIITGIQFIRFDITLEAAVDNVQAVPLEKFRDDIVARYDILLSDDFNKSDEIFYYTIDELEHVDKYLASQLRTTDAKSCAVLNLKDNDERIFASLLCLSTTNENINHAAVYQCARKLEFLFKNNIE